MAVCISDSAYTQSAQAAANAYMGEELVKLAISTAVALAQRQVAKKINDWKTEIADRQVALAEAAQGHAAGFYPAEAALVADSMAIPKVTPEYAALSNGWSAFTAEANDASRAGWLKASREMCMPPDRCDDGRWSSHARALTVDAGNFALRQAENRAQALNDVRYERMLEALKIGQGRIGGGAGGYAAAAGQIAGDVGRSIMGGINSAAEALGYELHRNRNAQWSTGYEPRTMQAHETQPAGQIDMREKSTRDYDLMGDFWSDRTFVPVETPQPTVKAQDLYPTGYPEDKYGVY